MTSKYEQQARATKKKRKVYKAKKSMKPKAARNATPNSNRAKRQAATAAARRKRAVATGPATQKKAQKARMLAAGRATQKSKRLKVYDPPKPTAAAKKLAEKRYQQHLKAFKAGMASSAKKLTPAEKRKRKVSGAKATTAKAKASAAAMDKRIAKIKKNK